MATGNEIAPEGFVYVCLACGKRSKDLYGAATINYGWDESCMLNCALIAEDKLIVKDGRVVEILKGGLPEQKNKPSIT